MPPAPSDHYANGRFFNPNARPHGIGSLFRWMRTRQPGVWPEWIPSEPGPPPPQRVAEGDLRVTLIGHSTCLIQFDGLNFLTDPIWSLRCSPVQWAGPKRHRAPGLRFEDLPPIDAILLSHDHYDHLDTTTLRRLAREHNPQIFCPLGVARQLRGLGFNAPVELDWWQSVPFNNSLRIHCTPAQHFAGRMPYNRNKTLWCSFMLETPAGNIYFAADTGFGPHFEQIAARFAPPRLALLPIGAYRPEWFMSPIHVSPEEAFRAHEILAAQTSVAIHYGTFALADDGATEPQDRIRELLLHEPGAAPFLILSEGIGHAIAPALVTSR